MKAYTKNGSYCIACENLDENYEAMNLILSKAGIQIIFADYYDFLDLETRIYYSITFVADKFAANEVFNELGITEIINKD